jgi:hypothetical protein
MSLIFPAFPSNRLLEFYFIRSIMWKSVQKLMCGNLSDVFILCGCKNVVLC